MVDSIHALSGRAAKFTHDREWGSYHDPKSLILALVGEVGELAELFQWVPANESVSSIGDTGRKVRVAEEMADVFIYLMHLANALDIDLGEAVTAKMDANEARFSVPKYRAKAPIKK